MMRIFRIYCSFLAIISLIGCAGEDVNELNAWLSQQKAAPPPKIVKAQEPLKFTPEKYEAITLVDPFSIKKLQQDGKVGLDNPSRGNALVQNELERRKEPLEQYTRESVAYVGSLNKNGQQVGLIKVASQLFYVKIGDHVGTNFGKIVSIKESELILKEIVQNATGDWEERVATLPLQEKN